jgi:hypothetical protein
LIFYLIFLVQEALEAAKVVVGFFFDPFQSQQSPTRVSQHQLESLKLQQYSPSSSMMQQTVFKLSSASTLEEWKISERKEKRILPVLRGTPKLKKKYHGNLLKTSLKV